MKKRQLRGFEIKERNCKEKLGIVRRYWATYFDAARTVQSLTSRELDDFLLSLRRDKGLAAETEMRQLMALDWDWTDSAYKLA